MTKTDTSREVIGRLCVRLCHPIAGFRPTVSDARDAAETLRALLTERDALQARAERAEARLKAWIKLASHCSIEEGVCCCGDDMENHSNPMDCGHSPVDHGSYVADQLVKDTRATLAQLDAEPAGVSGPAWVKPKLRDTAGKIVAAMEVYRIHPDLNTPMNDKIDEVERHLAALEPGPTHREVWEQAKEAAAIVARNACLVPPDGGSPTEEEVALCDEAERQIRAMPYPGDRQ